MILPVENQVCNLKYAKRLKELGVTQKSLWYWWCEWCAYPCVMSLKRVVALGDHCNKMIAQGELAVDHYEMFSSFTVSELGEMLPNAIKSKKYIIYNLEMSKLFINSKKMYYTINYTFYDQDGSASDIKMIRDLNEANARAKMLIWLIENGHVKVEDLNE